MIEIIPYQDRWPGWSAAIGRRLRVALGESALRIDHIGSTSVPGLAAKDVIDVQVSVIDLDAAVALLTNAGFVPYAENTLDHSPPGMDLPAHDLEKRMVGLPADERQAHLHLRVEGRLNQRYAILFRTSCALIRRPPRQLARRSARSLGTSATMRRRTTRSRIRPTTSSWPGPRCGRRTAGAQEAYLPTAAGVWTGQRVITGEAAYDPAADAWLALPPRPSREGPLPVWTGQEILLWGGAPAARASFASTTGLPTGLTIDPGEPLRLAALLLGRLGRLRGRRSRPLHLAPPQVGQPRFGAAAFISDSHGQRAISESDR